MRTDKGIQAYSLKNPLRGGNLPSTFNDSRDLEKEEQTFILTLMSCNFVQHRFVGARLGREVDEILVSLVSTFL